MPRDITQIAKDLYKAYHVHPIPYWYGCEGQKPSVELARLKTKQFPAYWTEAKLKNPASRLPFDQALKAPFCCDCIGWIRVLCLYDPDIHPLPFASTYMIQGKNYYKQAGMDISANAFRKAYGGKPIASLPEPTPDQAIFVSMDGHIGLYIGAGEVLEQTPPQLQKTALSKRSWTSWGIFPASWRDFLAKATRTTPAVSPQEITNSSTHLVQKGDTPWIIAEKLLDDGRRYLELAWLVKKDLASGKLLRQDPPKPYTKGTDIYPGELLGIQNGR